MNWDLKMKIIERFRSQANFAKEIHTDETLVSRVVRGRRKLKPAIQRLWADALQCKTRDIFADEG